ncbi:hypothetical protein [Desulfovibrio ferrophilus]|uniref:Uncharacterized protein n=1 Tax=Desulfovibrio ferrophilus TaxID=241368 RepID=A0A2Z6AZV5_9BACT|nr:hypothetical protein [Desulfovibrio ferrophilus]BBD08748.1 putative uncharacterized protein [Desulfovibrio ferrophilus]
MSVRILSGALLELGEDRITSADQDTERARVVSEVYEDERDSLLEEHPWNFAIFRAGLARLELVPAFGFAHGFRLPADCLYVISVEPETPYKIEGGNLLADLEALSIRYVRRVDDATQMPPTFRVALATRIAARVCKKITGSSAEKERLETLYRDRLRTAKGRDAQGGGTPDAARPDLFVNARR